SSRNSARRVFLLYRSKPVIIASVLCFILCIPPVLLALYPELLWKAETLIRVSLDDLSKQIDSLWEQLGSDPELRAQAEGAGINVDEVLGHRESGITLKREGQGFDPL